MFEPNALHIDKVLTNLSLAYKNEITLWRELMPVVKVGQRSDAFYVYSKENAYRLLDDKLSPKSHANEVALTVTDDNYSVKSHGLADWIPQETLDNADAPLDVEADTNEFLNSQLDLAQEKRVADLLQTAGNYPSGNKVDLVAGTDIAWGESADAPVQDLLTAVEACFMRANVLVFGIDAWLKFRTLPEILDAVKSSTRQQTTPGGLASAPEIAALFEVDKVLIARTRYITSAEGQTATYARVWGKHAIALHQTQSVGLKTLAFGKTFSESDRQTARDFDSKRGEKGAHYIKVAWNSDEKITASDLGYLIANAVV